MGTKYEVLLGASDFAWRKKYHRKPASLGIAWEVVCPAPTSSHINVRNASCYTGSSQASRRRDSVIGSQSTSLSSLLAPLIIVGQSRLTNRWCTPETYNPSLYFAIRVSLSSMHHSVEPPSSSSFPSLSSSSSLILRVFADRHPPSADQYSDATSTPLAMDTFTSCGLQLGNLTLLLLSSQCLAASRPVLAPTCSERHQADEEH